MLIIEGGDNVGKSTLIKQLIALDPNLRILHRERFKPNLGGTIAQSYLNAIMPPPDGDRRAHACSVADRFYASECIYGALFRGGCRMSAREHFVIKTVLMSYGAFVVHCDPGDEAIRASWEQREQMYQDPLVIAQAYRRRIRSIFHPLPIVQYEWNAPDAERQRVRIIERHRHALKHFALDLAWPVTHCTEASI